MERLLAVDYGRRRTGVAGADPLGITAQPLEAVEGGQETVLARIVALCAEREVDRVLLGLPLNMDGSEGSMAAEVRAFGERLRERTGRPVEFVDERLTSYEAEQQLRGLRRKKDRRDKGRIDAMAAARILADYLESRRRER